jgi:hypothetical protein
MLARMHDTMRRVRRTQRSFRQCQQWWVHPPECSRHTRRPWELRNLGRIVCEPTWLSVRRSTARSRVIRDKGCLATISSITRSYSSCTNLITACFARPYDTSSLVTMPLEIVTVSFKLDLHHEVWTRRLSRRATMPQCRPTRFAFTGHVQNHVNTTPPARTTGPTWLVTQHNISLTTQNGAPLPFCYDLRAPYASQSKPYTP